MQLLPAFLTADYCSGHVLIDHLLGNNISQIWHRGTFVCEHLHDSLITHENSEPLKLFRLHFSPKDIPSYKLSYDDDDAQNCFFCESVGCVFSAA